VSEIMSESDRVEYEKLVAMDPRCSIAYLIPHLPQSLERASLFGWYTDGLHEAAAMILAATVLPADIRELYTEIPYVLANRLAGTVWPTATPIETTSLQQIISHLKTPFRVCLSSTEEVATEIDRLIAISVWPILHISTIPGAKRVHLSTLNTVVIDGYVREVLNVLAEVPDWSQFVRRIRGEFSASARRTPKNHPLKRGLHNVVLPNECALEAFGRKFQKASRISMPVETLRDPQRYVQRICASVDAVAAERSRLLENVSPDVFDYRYVFASSSVFWGHYRTWRRKANAAPVAIRKDLKHALKSMIHASTYFDSVPFVEHQGQYMPTQTGLIVMEERAKDMRSYTATLATIAASTLAPIVRIEPKINNARVAAAELARCVRANARHHFVRKTSRMTNTLSSVMRGLIDPRFLEYIDRVESRDRVEGMKFLTDVPLELMKTGGVPVGLRFDCSRISPLPGNLSHLIAEQGPVHLRLSAFDEVLIVRSFSRDDPIRSLLSDALNRVSSGAGYERVKFRFVDVANEKELIGALKSCSGAAVIFDCHGAFDKSLGMGVLVVGGKPLSFWNLRGQCHLPPIVMFSACDTQPIDGGHGSVATSAFALGAHAVLATSFPVSAPQAALFNARLLLRLDKYLPAAVKIRKHVTWREVVSGMLRMSYVVQVMRLLAKFTEIKLTRDQMSSVQFEVTNYVSARSPMWHDVLLSEIASRSGVNIDVVRGLVDRWCGLTDAMKYVQIGNPERVIISNDFSWEPNSGVSGPQEDFAH
jgi:hypothetical protein